MRFASGARSYLSGVLVYGLAVLWFTYGPFYADFLSGVAYKIILLMYFGYLTTGLIYYRYKSPGTQESKPLLLLRTLWKITKHRPLSQLEKNAALFLFVKFFFLPLMIQFLSANIRMLSSGIAALSWYGFLFTLLFTVDTLVFVFGYLMESKRLGNEVRSVEPTLIGWLAAIICYPPLNWWVGKYIPWGANDYVNFGNLTATMVVRIVILALLLVYVWASLALGPKASNLTNRGIVTRFPYSVVRHPAYISKNLIWWLTLLPAINIYFALGMLLWSGIYYLRAVTEERHLGKDVDYRSYCRKVKYRFIPFVF